MLYKRGAPKGNRNRLVHGRHTSARIAFRREARQAIRIARALLDEVQFLAATEPFDGDFATAILPAIHDGCGSET